MCGILVSAAGFINNGGMLECSVAWIQYTTMQNGWWDMMNQKCGTVRRGTIFNISLQKMISGN